MCTRKYHIGVLYAITHTAATVQGTQTGSIKVVAVRMKKQTTANRILLYHPATQPPRIHKYIYIYACPLTMPLFFAYRQLRPPPRTHTHTHTHTSPPSLPPSTQYNFLSHQFVNQVQKKRYLTYDDHPDR